MTTFSVVIPTYNRRDYLAECLESVFAQALAPSEVIVVDDGSTDGTLEYLATLSDRVGVVRQTNAGPGSARNRGARETSGDYLAFLDSDDLWMPWALEAMAALIERHGRPALLFACFLDFETPDALKQICKVQVRGDFYPDFLASAASGCFAGAGMMAIARDAFVTAGGFREDRLNAEDHDLALRLGTAPGFVNMAAPVTIGHRVHAGNEMGDLQNTLRGLERLVSAEADGTYPGGPPRRAERRRIIARHVRSAVLSAARAGGFAEATRLYRSTFLWNARLGRFPYLAAAPLTAWGFGRVATSG